MVWLEIPTLYRPEENSQEIEPRASRRRESRVSSLAYLKFKIAPRTQSIADQ